MADQADWPDIYIDSSVGDGGDGSEADPYNAFGGDINWTTGGDNSVYDYYAGTPTASVTINLKKGKEWRETFTYGMGGTESYPIILQAYGAGNNPLIKGSDIVTGWTAHGSLPNVWQATFTAANIPTLAFFDDTQGTRKASAEDLAQDYDWWWASNVMYQYSATDPDTRYTSPGTEANIRQYCIYAPDTDYVTVDGIDTQHARWVSIYVAGSDYCIVRNLVCSYNFVGVKFAAPCIYCTMENVESCYNIGDGIGCSGGETNTVEYLLVTGCEIHHNWYVDGISSDGSGIKAFGTHNSTLTKSSWHHNSSGAIRLDGIDSTWGCNYNMISENLIYSNGGEFDGQSGSVDSLMLEFSHDNIIKHNLIYDSYGGGWCIGISHDSSRNIILGNICYGSTDTSVAAIRTRLDAGVFGANYIVGNIAAYSYWGIQIAGNEDVVLRNNIVFGTTVGVDLRLNADYYDIDSDYNVFTGEAEGCVKLFGGTAMTIAEWNTASENDAHSISDDPQFVDAVGHNFALKSTSPARKIGKDLGPPYHTGILAGSTWPDDVSTADRDDYR